MRGLHALKRSKNTASSGISLSVNRLKPGCWVIKIGSALITNNGQGLNSAHLQAWADQMATLVQQGYQIALVSSGAVAVGMQQMGWMQRPTELHRLQAAAAIGQMGLVQAWEHCFQQRGLHTAQVLLTHDDLANRQRYLNARSTLSTLLQLGVIPVINENDVVANDELRLGDNDTLAALVTNLLVAEQMVLLTDQQGLYTQDPRQYPAATLLSSAAVQDPALDQMAGMTGGRLGRGGMYTKVRAARLASRSGAGTVIASGRQPEILLALARGEQPGTRLQPGRTPETARKRWLAGQLQVRGQLILDSGAVKVLRHAGTSLLAVGVSVTHGDYQRGELVACLDAAGQEVARGLINYSAAETRQIVGQSSDGIAAILGYVNEPELIHRDNLVLV